MASQPGFLATDGQSQALSTAGNPLERLRVVVGFDLFLPELEALSTAPTGAAAVGRPTRLRIGGRRVRPTRCSECSPCSATGSGPGFGI